MAPPIFISGPHGSGKTTLIKKLLKDSRFIENDFDINFLKECPSIASMDNFERCLVRLYHRLYLTSYANDLSSCNDYKTVITSRSIYDSIAYIKSYNKIEWISDDQAKKMMFILNNPINMPYTIILNPNPYEIKSRLDGRISQGTRQDRDHVFSYEDTYEFIQILYKEFSSLKNLENVLYLEDNERSDIEKIYSWIDNISKEIKNE